MLKSTVVRMLLQVLHQLIVVKTSVLFEQKRPMDMTVLEKNILPKELKREIKTLNTLFLKSEVMNLSKKCFYFS